MPRGYSYDHFQVPKREPRERATPPDTLKAATAHKGEALPLAESQGGLHYGRKNAETLRRLEARAQQRQTQGADRPAAPARAKRAPAKAKKAAPAGRAKTGAPAKAKTPAQGGKTLGRVAAAAKRGLQRAAKKVTSRRKTPKQR
jgi:hypothetical protein